MGSSNERPSDGVLSSAIDFALPHTLSDTVRESEAVCTGPETYFIYFTVSDTGRGIKPEEKVKLFSRFQQASPRTYTSYGGSGLGLFISRELAELQGGEIGKLRSTSVIRPERLTIIRHRHRTGRRLNICILRKDTLSHTTSRTTTQQRAPSTSPQRKHSTELQRRDITDPRPGNGGQRSKPKSTQTPTHKQRLRGLDSRQRPRSRRFSPAHSILEPAHQLFHNNRSATKRTPCHSYGYRNACYGWPHRSEKDTRNAEEWRVEGSCAYPQCFGKREA
jgi:hypothetical protein